MNHKLHDIIKSRNIVIPLYIYKLFPKLNIDLETFIFLMYLYSFGDKIVFDPNAISQELGISIEQVLNITDKLTNAKLVKFEVIKNDKNIREEFLSMEYFYEKLSLLVIEEKEDSKESHDMSNIYDSIEKEFGRVLSPIEYEIIKAWRENNNSDEIILEALKEAVFNGVTNLRYMDKILSEWQKKGIKTVEDVHKNKKEYKSNSEKVEIFEYNWLDDDE